MENKKESAIKHIRLLKGLSQKELAERSGINFRSLQDYEQGHKDIASAKAETLYKLSKVLECDMEVLLSDCSLDIEETVFSSSAVNRLVVYRERLTNFAERIERKTIYSSEYKIHGYWKYEDDKWYLVFCWNKETIVLPFEAVFTEQTLPWLEDVAVMKMNQFIQGQMFNETYDR